jgi:hypothetical protein
MVCSREAYALFCANGNHRTTYDRPPVGDDPDALNYRTDSFDPTICGITVSGDVTIWFEILDEQHAIRILDIEG